jgi:hypothetical protein
MGPPLVGCTRIQSCPCEDIHLYQLHDCMFTMDVPVLPQHVEHCCCRVHLSHINCHPSITMAAQRQSPIVTESEGCGACGVLCGACGDLCGVGLGWEWGVGGVGGVCVVVCLWGGGGGVWDRG